MQTIKSWIPNFITCCNLLCGCLGIVAVFISGQFSIHLLLFASYCIAVASIFDFFDGFVARLLNVHSEIGKQLDSLADMVTFGVLPGMILFKLLSESIYRTVIIDYPSLDQYDSLFIFTKSSGLLVLFSLLIPVFSALRLAKFNIDTRQTNSFIGLPTPANSIFIGSLPLIIQFNPEYNFIIMNQYFLIAVSVIMSFLLVAELPLFALKFKNFSWADNKVRYVFLGLSLVMLAVFQFIGIPFTILLYILLSLIFKEKPANA